MALIHWEGMQFFKSPKVIWKQWNGYVEQVWIGCLRLKEEVTKIMRWIFLVRPFQIWIKLSKYLFTIITHDFIVTVLTLCFGDLLIYTPSVKRKPVQLNIYKLNVLKSEKFTKADFTKKTQSKVDFWNCICTNMGWREHDFLWSQASAWIDIINYH